MNLTDDQKFKILKVAYEERRKEVVFPRERSLKVTSWMIGVFLAFSAGTTAIRGDKLSYLLLLIPLLLLSAVVTAYLYDNHKTYCERWTRVADVEEALQFFEDGVYLTSKSLNEPDLRNPKVKFLGTVVYITAIWFSAMASVTLVIVR